MTSDIQNIILKLSTIPLSKKTLKEIKSTANQIFKTAIQNRIINYNPVDAVIIPKKAPQKTRQPLNLEQQKWILETPHRCQIAAMIMLYAGLRRGELIPLTWSDIDLKNATISVNKTVEMINNQPHIKSTAKTKNGIRNINIPEILVDFLKLKKNNATSILVCPSTKGKLITVSGWKFM